MNVRLKEIDTMNVELTTKCPLHCPQCYCSLTGGKDIDPQTAIFWIQEGGKAGVKDVMLSGGETLCYPHLCEVVAAAKKYCGTANVALSGYNFSQKKYEELLNAGVGGIFISLNGSTEQINSLSRDGYQLAINALRLLHKNQYDNTTINWVMHSNNADDFANILFLAETYNVAHLTVMAVKPDSKNQLKTIPSREQMLAVKEIIHSYKGKTKIYVESCFSPMLALLCDTKLFGNLNVGKNRGCCAGRSTFSVSVDGKLSPCRHLEYYESYRCLQDYFEQSPIQNTIRSLEQNTREPCLSCKYSYNCLHCLAINSKINNQMFFGNAYCPIYETRNDLRDLA